MPIAIEFKSDTINIVEVRSKSGVFDMRNAQTLSFPDEWLDAQGIKEMDDFYLLMNQALEVGNYKSKETYLCINNISVIYRELIVPNIETKKLAMVVRSEMMDVLNLTPDYVMDFITIEELVNENNEPMIRVLAVASLSSALESYISLMKRLKLKLVCIDSSTNAIIKFVDKIPELNSLEQLIFVDVGNGHLRLYLFEFGKYILSRNAKLLYLKNSADDEVIGVIEEHINKMIQFSFTRENKSGTKRIVLAGKDELLAELNTRVLEDLLVPCEILPQPSFLTGTGDFETRFVNTFGTLIRK